MGPIFQLWLLLASIATAQVIEPSNSTTDLTDPSTSPRFFLNATGSVQFPGFEIAPLGEYAYISRNIFLSIAFTGTIVETDASNANQVESNDFNYVSCDPEDYANGNIDVDNILNLVVNQQGSLNRDKSTLIFYSTRSNHCNATGLGSLPTINGIFTTVDPVVAAQIASRDFTRAENAVALLTPDKYSYGGSAQGNGVLQPPTTAIAMIILYSITGVITALFVIIIITGAVRAHRHPERYGPRNGGHGRSGQSRAKGIARAMLETIPIVKFGDQDDKSKDKDGPRPDIEMVTNDSTVASGSSKAGDKTTVTTTAAAVELPTSSTAGAADLPAPRAAAELPTATVSTKTGGSSDAIQNADGSDDAGALQCSICTEDFQRGEEVRVLPCNHKFHPACVDPWLLNVSGTCPLCRISLAPGSENAGNGETSTDENMPPPLSPFTDRRSQAIHSLMAIAYGSREERVTALRRYGAERRNRDANLDEEERYSRARRFREALRIRTRTHEPNEQETAMRNSGVDALTGPQIRL